MSLENDLAASWTRGADTALSLSPVNSPQPVSYNTLTLHIPKVFLRLGLSQASSLLASLQRKLLGELLNILSKVIVSTELISEGNSFDLVPVKVEDAFRPDALLPESALMNVPGMIQLMENQPNKHFRFSPSSSGEKGQQASRKQQQKSDEPSKDNSDDGEERGTSPGSSTSYLSSSGSGVSLIELVAQDRIRTFSDSTLSQYPRRVNVEFIKLLSRAGLAQVIVEEGSKHLSWPLAISKTLLKFLITYQEKRRIA